MVKVYSISLVIGVLGLLVVTLGGAIADNSGHPDKDPGDRIGRGGRMVIGVLVGFGMGGLSAECAPQECTWGVALAWGVLGGVGAALWVRYAYRSVQDG